VLERSYPQYPLKLALIWLQYTKVQGTLSIKIDRKIRVVRPHL